VRIVRNGAVATSRETLGLAFTMQTVGTETRYCIASLDTMPRHQAGPVTPAISFVAGRIRVGRPRAAPVILAEALPVQHSRLPTDPVSPEGCELEIGGLATLVRANAA